MVDVSEKDVTVRRAVARGVLQMEAATLSRILEGDMPKGDVLSVARTAGIGCHRMRTSICSCTQRDPTAVRGVSALDRARLFMSRELG